MTWSNTPLPSPADAHAPRYAWVLLGVTPALHPLLVMRGAINTKGDCRWRFCNNGDVVQLESVAQWAPASDAHGHALLPVPSAATFDPPLGRTSLESTAIALSQAEAENNRLRRELANAERRLTNQRKTIKESQERLAAADQQQHNVIMDLRRKLRELETLAPVSIVTENRLLKDRVRLFAKKLSQFSNDIGSGL